MKEQLFRDIESGDVITLRQLYREFIELTARGEIDVTDFEWYLDLCCGKNGTLEPVEADKE